MPFMSFSQTIRRYLVLKLTRGHTTSKMLRDSKEKRIIPERKYLQHYLL